MTNAWISIPEMAQEAISLQTANRILDAAFVADLKRWQRGESVAAGPRGLLRTTRELLGRYWLWAVLWVAIIGAMVTLAVVAG